MLLRHRVAKTARRDPGHLLAHASPNLHRAFTLMERRVFGPDRVTDGWLAEVFHRIYALAVGLGCIGMKPGSASIRASQARMLG
jgi:hypothetical protein